MFAAGCGEESAPQSSSGAHRRIEALNLRLAPDSAPRPSRNLYRRLTPSPDSDWSFDQALSHEYIKLPGEGTPLYGLMFDAVGETVITIPGPFDPRRFNVMGLELDAGVRRRFHVRFFREDTDSFARAHGSSRSQEREIVEFEVPDATLKWDHIDRITITTDDLQRRLRIYGASLIAAPAMADLPVPEDGPEHILSAGQQRSGVGVLEDRAVESEFDAPQGGELRFSYVVPSGIKDPGRNPKLTLTLSSDAGVEAEHEFDLDSKKAQFWQTERISLEAFQDSRVTAQWAVSGKRSPVCAIAEPGVVHPGGVPRKVLLITSDTHRFDHTGSSGRGVEVQTPALDALAKRGLFFDDCFTSTNVTNPSHIALMTGTSPRDTGIQINNAILSDAAPTLAEAFREAGYVTYSSVSIKHLSPHSSGLGQGFDRASSPDFIRNREAEDTIGQVIKWMNNSEDLSVFVWVHLFDAHTPYETEDPYATMYYQDPERAFDPEAGFPDNVPDAVREKLFPELQDIEYPRAQYKSEVSYLDAQLDRLFSHKTMRDAIIGFTADHGESLGGHGIFFSHDGLYPDSIHVPMIVSFPDGPTGVHSQAPVEQIDLGRTLLDLAGLVGADFPGENMIAMADMEVGDAGPRYSIAAHKRSAALSEDGWHILLSMSSRSGEMTLEDPEFHEVKLFNLREDPNCENDLLQQEFERAKLMRQQLVEWLLDAKHLNWDKETITDAETIKELEALGYTAGTQETQATKNAPFINEQCVCDWCAKFTE